MPDGSDIVGILCIECKKFVNRGLFRGSNAKTCSVSCRLIYEAKRTKDDLVSETPAIVSLEAKLLRELSRRLEVSEARHRELQAFVRGFVHDVERLLE